MKKTIRLTESELIQIIKESINEQGGPLALGDMLKIMGSDPTTLNYYTDDPHPRNNSKDSLTDKDAVIRLFGICRKKPDSQLKLNDSRNLQLYTNLYNQIQGLSNNENTIKVLKQIKTMDEFCAVDRLFSRKKNQNLYNQLADEWGLSWNNVLEGVENFYSKYRKY